jgi:AcrR family transcriptional regulator
MTEENRTLQDLKAEEKLARKNLIVDAAIRLFSSRPLKEVGVRDIAKEAGISPSLIYRYFADQDELILEAINRETGEMIQQFQKKMDNNKNLTLQAIATEYVYYLFRNDHFFRMMTHFILDSTIKAEHLHRFDENIRNLLEIFDKVFIAAGVTDKPRTYSHALFACLNGILITYRHYPGREEIEIKKQIEILTKVIGELFSHVK